MENNTLVNEKKAGLGYVIKLLRKARDLSMKELAQKMDVSPAYVSEVEANKKHPSLDMLSKFSTALGVSRSSILYFDEEGEKHGYDHQQLLLEILQKIGN